MHAVVLIDGFEFLLPFPLAASHVEVDAARDRPSPHYLRSTAMQTSDILNRAADLIEERGWGHGADSMTGRDYLGDDAGVCIMGALFAAQKGRLAQPGEADADTYGVVETCDATRALKSYLHLDRTVQPATLWRWNDSGSFRGTLSQERVIETLRACAVIEASRERESVPA